MAVTKNYILVIVVLFLSTCISKSSASWFGGNVPPLSRAADNDDNNKNSQNINNDNAINNNDHPSKPIQNRVSSQPVPSSTSLAFIPSQKFPTSSPVQGRQQHNFSTIL